jgi:hypothetical protein
VLFVFFLFWNSSMSKTAIGTIRGLNDAQVGAQLFSTNLVVAFHSVGIFCFQAVEADFCLPTPHVFGRQVLPDAHGLADTILNGRPVGRRPGCIPPGAVWQLDRKRPADRNGTVAACAAIKVCS